jgi:hypothetical protein
MAIIRLLPNLMDITEDREEQVDLEAKEEGYIRPVDHHSVVEWAVNEQQK